MTLVRAGNITDKGTSGTDKLIILSIVIP